MHNSSDLLALIESKYGEMSKGQKIIADYIREHYDKAAYMTALKFGQTVGVSESTVVRFASELGFDGYPELQTALQDLMRSKLTTVQRIELSTDKIGDGDILDAVLHHDIEKIRRTLEETSRDDFNRAVDIISSCHTIYIIGARSSASLAQFLSHYFDLIFPRVKLVHASTRSELFEQILRIDEKDALIAISFPRYSRQTIEALKYANSRGTNIIAITDCASSPLTQFSDCNLFAKSDMASFVDSLVAPLSLINALIVAVSRRCSETVTRNLERLEEIWREFEVYEPAKSGDDGGGKDSK